MVKYSIKCDAENNPPEVVARNELRATITLYDPFFREHFLLDALQLETLNLTTDLDKIMFSIADTLGFGCVAYDSGVCQYVWWIPGKHAFNIIAVEDKMCIDHKPWFDLADPELLSNLRMYFRSLSCDVF